MSKTEAFVIAGSLVGTVAWVGFMWWLSKSPDNGKYKYFFHGMQMRDEKPDEKKPD